MRLILNRISMISCSLAVEQEIHYRAIVHTVCDAVLFLLLGVGEEICL